MRILGVDPGLAGGFTVLNEHGAILTAGNFPTQTIKKHGKSITRLNGYELASHIDTASPTHAFVENVTSRPRQAGQFQFGINTGVIHGILFAFGIEMHLVTPTVWKSVYRIKRHEDETKADVKTQAREIASRIFPEQAHFFARVKDDGVAESALIALYGLGVLAPKKKES